MPNIVALCSIQGVEPVSETKLSGDEQANMDREDLLEMIEELDTEMAETVLQREHIVKQFKALGIPSEYKEQARKLKIID